MILKLLSFLVSGIAAYLLGSCNSSIIIIRLLKHEDIREHGSKNAGLTNTLRCYGKGAAALTLLSDLAKGIIAVFMSRLVCHIFGVDMPYIGYFAGLCAILGHVYPIFYGFKGGKGILITATALLAVNPLASVLLVSTFAVLVAITKYVSLSSICAASVYPIVTFLIQHFVQGESIRTCLISAIFTVINAAMMIFMHRTNIQRLKNGTENKFSFSSKREGK